MGLLRTTRNTILLYDKNNRVDRFIVGLYYQGIKTEQKHECRPWSALSNFWNRKMDFELKKSTIGITELDGHLEKPLCNMVFPFDCKKLYIVYKPFFHAECN